MAATPIGRDRFFSHAVPAHCSCSARRAYLAIALFTLPASRVCSSAMERSPATAINLISSILYELVKRQIYLTQYGLMAERHWREFRPIMVRDLKAKGKLQQALFEAQETTLDEIETLCRKLETEQTLTPRQVHDQAWEMIREKYILLPPEEDLS
jgi:hypothetical protein